MNLDTLLLAIICTAVRCFCFVKQKQLTMTFNLAYHAWLIKQAITHESFPALCNKKITRRTTEAKRNNSLKGFKKVLY